MSDFKYDDDIVSETSEQIEPVTEEVIELPITEEIAIVVVEETVAEKVVEETKPKKKAKKEEPVVEETPKTETVAVFSTRTVSWEGVGNIKRGYNIVTKEQADRWLTRNHVRVATPEEILKELNG